MGLALHLGMQAATWYALIAIGFGSVFALYTYDLQRMSARLRRDGVAGEGQVHEVRNVVRRIYYQSGIHFRVPICLVSLTYAADTGRTRGGRAPCNGRSRGSGARHWRPV